MTGLPIAPPPRFSGGKEINETPTFEATPIVIPVATPNVAEDSAPTAHGASLDIPVQDSFPQQTMAPITEEPSVEEAVQPVVEVSEPIDSPAEELIAPIIPETTTGRFSHFLNPAPAAEPEIETIVKTEAIIPDNTTVLAAPPEEFNAILGDPIEEQPIEEPSGKGKVQKVKVQKVKVQKKSRTFSVIAFTLLACGAIGLAVYGLLQFHIINF